MSDYRILKLKNGDFEVIAERPTQELAERVMVWNACFADTGTVLRVVKDGQNISEVRKTQQNDSKQDNSDFASPVRL